MKTNRWRNAQRIAPVLLLCLFAFLLPKEARAQSGGIITSGIIVLSSSGHPVAGATVTVCNVADNGVPCTQTVNIFQDANLTIPALNPGKTDANGNFVAFATPGVYHFTVSGNGVTLNGQPFMATVSTPTAGGGNVLLAGNNVMTGNNTFTGQNTITAYNINNVITVDGNKYTTLSAAAADAACTVGCTIDMRGNSSVAALNLGSFDPASKTITVLLGPYTYSVTQIVIRGGLKIYGAANSPSSGAGTIIQSLSTSTPPFILSSAVPALGVDLGHFRVYCGVGNTTQIGISIVPAANGGLWYSQMEDLLIGGDGTHECGGEGILFNGDAGGSPEAINQFIHMSDIYAFRRSGGGPALKLFGLNAQFQFDHCQFDGPSAHDSNKVNVVIDSGTQSILPANTIVFHDTTFQHAWGATGVAVQINGCGNCVIDTGHFEDDNGGIRWAIGNNFGNAGNVVRNSLFTTNTGQDGGSGFITSTDIFSQVAFDNNDVYGTPDTMHAGDTTYLSHQGTFNGFAGTPGVAPASSFRPIVGVDKTGPAIKHVRGSTGSLAPGRSSITVTWPTPWADISYTYACQVIDTGNGATAAGLILERANSIGTINSITLTINNAGSTVTGLFDCIGMHD